MKVYVAGPMRGYPAFNFPAFDHAAAELRKLGHEVCNPAEHDRDKHGTMIDESEDGNLAEIQAKGFSLRDALAYDLSWIAKHADAVCVLTGWEDSLGALAEVALADALGLVVASLWVFQAGLEGVVHDVAHIDT